MLMWLLGLLPAVEFFESGLVSFSTNYILGALGGDPRAYAWVQAAYSIGAMLMIVNHNWLAGWLGYRRYLMAALLTFSVACLAAACSRDLDELLCARALQGFASGGLFTAARVMVVVLYQGADRQKAMVVFGLGIAFSTSLAPALAGEILEHWDWRYLFYLSAIPALAILPLVLGALPPEARPPSVDLPDGGQAVAFAFFGGGIYLLLSGLSLSSADFLSYPARQGGQLGAGLLLLATFLCTQWSWPHPLLPLHRLVRSSYLVGLVTYLIYYSLSSLYGFLFPVLAQQVLGLPVRTVGWLSCFSGLTAVAALFLYLPLVRRYPPGRPMMALGLLCMAVVGFGFSRLEGSAEPASLTWLLALRGLFLLLTILPVASGTFQGLSDATFGIAYQVKNLLRQFAYSSSAALVAVQFQMQQISAHDRLLDTLSHRTASTQVFLTQTQTLLTYKGLPAFQARAGAMALLGAVTARQGVALACLELSLILAKVALLGALVVLLLPRPRALAPGIQDME